MSLTGPYPATTPDGNMLMVGYDEYRMLATFCYTGRAPAPIRIEFPKEAVKTGEPDQRLTLREAMKVWEIPPIEELEKSPATAGVTALSER